MQGVVDWYGLDNPYISAILEPIGKRIPDLPTLEGVQVLCWGHALGRCTMARCKYKSRGGHVDPAAYMDAWAAATCALLQPGINALMGQQTPPVPKKAKLGEQTTSS
jgi:hypothetical protein